MSGGKEDVRRQVSSVKPISLEFLSVTVTTRLNLPKTHSDTADVSLGVNISA